VSGVNIYIFSKLLDYFGGSIGLLSNCYRSTASL